MFTTVHRLKAVGICPNNGMPDHYDIEIHPGCDRILFCESIVGVVDAMLATPVYQEAFTQALADRLQVKVVTTCPHLEGGRVVVECEAIPRTALELAVQDAQLRTAWASGWDDPAMSVYDDM